MSSILPYVIYFSIFDMTLSQLKLNGVYYILHVLHNMVVISDVIRGPYTSIPSHSIDLVIGFHMYHILLYFNKMRIIDWIHHILMCGILIAIYYEDVGGVPLRYSLFFTTGLPGMCDYTLLALERNYVISNNFYRVGSKYINVWIRGPGCVISAYEILRFTHQSLVHHQDYEVYACYLFAFLVFWNGCYFSMKAVEAEAIRIERMVK